MAALAMAPSERLTQDEANRAEPDRLADRLQARLDMVLGPVVDTIRRDAVRRPAYLTDTEVAAGGE